MPFFVVLFSFFLATSGLGGRVQSSEDNQLKKPTQDRPEYIIIDENTP